MTTERIALVTGASKGIGRHVADLLVKKGYYVYGTCRNPSMLSKQEELDGVIYKKLRLGCKSDVAAIFDSIQRIDVLVNNAGESLMGPIELVTDEDTQNIFNTCCIGHIQVIRHALPMMRAQRSGLIINVTSFAAHAPVPFSSAYAGAKAAMETITFGLQNEVRRFGIHVTAVAPLFVNTDIRQKKVCLDHSEYYDFFQKASAQRDKDIKNGVSPAYVAKKIVSITSKKNPRVWYAIGRGSSMMSALSKLMSHDRIVKCIGRRFGV